MDAFSVTTGGPDQTARVAAVVAGRLRAGDVVLLTGDLAAGKTTFVKGIAAALGSTAVVTSPTFTLAQFYPTPGPQIMHVDTYRLASLGEYRDLGLDEFVAESVSLFEWGEKVESEFDCHLAVEFRAEDPSDRRVLTLSSTCERWTAELDAMRSELHEEMYAPHLGDRDLFG
jgi:tRNA threonylcarbamoyladenosine biosynthesis protein TsaE